MKHSHTFTPAHWEEAVALLAHPDARSHCLELEQLSTGYGARIYPPQTQHLRGNFSALSGSFYGVADTPRAAVMEAVSHWNEFRAGHDRARAIN